MVRARNERSSVDLEKVSMKVCVLKNLKKGAEVYVSQRQVWEMHKNRWSSGGETWKKLSVSAIVTISANGPRTSFAGVMLGRVGSCSHLEDE